MINQRGHRASRFLKRLAFALALAMILLGLIEGSLRVVPSTRDRGKFFLPVPDGQWRFGLADTGIVFSDPKPADTFRIMCFGESAVEGSIYNPVSTFPNYLRVMLQSLSRSQRVEVINCGKTAMTSAEVLDTVRASLRFEPDLIVIYCGNNELTHYKPLNQVETPRLFPPVHFLKLHTRLVPLIYGELNSLHLALGGAKILMEVPLLDLGMTRFPPARRQAIKQNYGDNLAAMLAAAAESNTPVILCTPAGNLRGWPPQRSRYPESMPSSQRMKLEQDMKAAERAYFNSELGPAATMIAAILSQAPDHARAHFFQGQIALRQGDRGPARNEFVLAQDLDDSGFNRPQYYDNEEVRKLAEKYHAHLADFERIFDQACPDGISGFELINDGCHPTVLGQITIAAHLAAMVGEQWPDRFNAPTIDDLIGRKEQWFREIKLTDGFLAKRTHEMAFYLAFASDDRLINEHAIELFGDLQRLTPDSTLPAIGTGLVRLRQGEEEAGRQAFTAGLGLSRDHFAAMSKLYFRHYLRWESPYLWVRAQPGVDFHSILRDYLEVTGVVPVSKNYELPLAEADHIYRWSAAPSSLTDLTGQIARRLEERKRIAPGASAPSAPLLVYGPGAKDKLVGVERMAASPDGTFRATGPDPVLRFQGFAINPLRYSTLSIRAALSPDGEAAQGQICLYWKSSRASQFTEEFKSCRPPQTEGRPRTYDFELADNPNWIMIDSVDALRLDPTEGKINLDLEKMELIEAPKPSDR
jgi:lysophospholipase L1-like esterase